MAADAFHVFDKTRLAAGVGATRAGKVVLHHIGDAAGVKVRLGTDNVRDWFFPFGDGDMLETARLGAITAHLDDTSQLVSAICGGCALLEEGMPGDLVLIPATSLDDALARRPAGRLVFKSGRRIV